MWYKRFKGLITVLLCVHAAFAQSGFYRNYGGDGNDYGLGVVGTFDKGYAVVGATESFGHGAVDVYLLKIDSLGDYLWSKTFGGPNIEWGYDMVQTADSGFVIGGYSNSFGVGYDAYVIKTDKLGNQEWFTAVDIGHWEFVYSLVVLPNNELLVVGEVIDLTSGIADGLIIKMNDAGDTLWTRRLGEEWNDRINAVSVTHEGDYLLAGTSQNEEGVWRAWMVKMDELGEIIWEYFYGLDGEYEAMDIIEMVDGTYLVTGTSNGSNTNGRDHLLLKLFPDGTLFFANALDDVYEDFGVKSLQYASQSGFITIGYTDSHGFGGLEIRTSERDNYLNYMGTSNYNHFYGTSKDEWVNDADTTYDKGFVLVGITESTQFGSASIVVVKKDSTSYSPIFTSEVYDLAADLAWVSQAVTIYPNPAREKLYIQGLKTSENLKYSIYTIEGLLLQQGTFANYIPVDLSSGVYILHLVNENMYVKFVKE
jgi:hypothetical protein